MKEKISVALAFVLLLTVIFSGCTINTKSEISSTTTKATVSTGESHSKKSITLTNCYDRLDSEAQRQCYNSIIENSTKFTYNTEDNVYLMEKIDVSDYNLEVYDVEKVIDAVLNDNPQIFWLDLNYTYTTISGIVTDIQLYSVMSESQYIECKKQLDKQVKAFVKSVKKIKTTVELELSAHDFITSHCEYEKKSSEDDTEPYTAYGAIVSGRAVCQGYTKAFQLLLSKVGINSVNVSGTSNNVNHIWNAVSLDGTWYYVDVTWDDAKNQSTYDYFNITTKQLKRNHTINHTYSQATDDEWKDTALNFFVPKCKKIDYNFYYMFGSHLEDINNNTLAEDLAQSADNGDEYFYIYVDPETMNFTITYDQLFSDSIYGFADYIVQANKIATKNKLSTTTSVYKNKKLNAIAVKLNYE